MAESLSSLVNNDDDDFMLTTLDNPNNPFTQFDQWLQFDNEHGYDTMGTLARFAPVGILLTEGENSEIINEAIESIMNIDPFCRWIKVTRKNADKFANKAKEQNNAKTNSNSVGENSIEIPK